MVFSQASHQLWSLTAHYQLCLADEEFPEGKPPVLMAPTKVYTREGVLHCSTYAVPCLDHRCQFLLRYSGQKEQIFMYNECLGIAVEVFWDFISLVMGGRMSFSKFCREKTRQYVTTCCKSAPFLSNKTFIQLVFGIIARFQIDFRAEIDPICGHNPKVLACDGTKIGVSVKMSDLKHPVTKPDISGTELVKHKKTNRCLLPCPLKLPTETNASHKAKSQQFKRARKFLRVLCLCAKEGNSHPYSDLEFAEERLLFLQVVGDLGRQELLDLFVMYIDRDCPTPVFQRLTDFLLLFMISDVSVCAVLPFRFHQQILSCCEAIVDGEECQKQLLEMNGFAPELGSLLHTCIVHNRTGTVVKFVQELVQNTEYFHSSCDDVTPPAAPQEDSYNPPSGAAYYFTGHGKQVRQMPGWDLKDVQKKRRGKDGPAECTKLFPQVSMGGFGYMFLFFCPLHGHCYGFHLIDGGRGGKTPLQQCTSSWRNLLRSCIMTLRARCQSTASTELPTFSNVHGFGMICFMGSHTFVESVSSLKESTV